MSMLQYKIMNTMNNEVRRQESIARNMASFQIPGYRRETLIEKSFSHELDSDNPESGSGVASGQVQLRFETGAIKPTGRPLDFALNGGQNVFFEVTAPNGQVMYTRNGRFQLNAEREFVTSEGYSVNTNRGTLELGNGDIMDQIVTTEEGLVQLRQDDRSFKELGQMKVVYINDLEKLKRSGTSYFTLTPEEQLNPEIVRDINDDDQVVIQAGALEQANTEVVQEMVEMISSMRHYEMAAKFLKSKDGLSTKEFQVFR